MKFSLNIDWIAGLSEIFIFSIINFLVVYSVIYTTSAQLHYPTMIKNVTWLGVHILCFALLLNICNPIRGAVVFNNLLIIDDFSILIKSIVLASTITTLVLGLDYSKHENLNCRT